MKSSLTESEAGSDVGDEEAEPPRRHGPGRGGTEWPASCVGLGVCWEPRPVVELGRPG
jgi:hypothetical protein